MSPHPPPTGVASRRCTRSAICGPDSISATHWFLDDDAFTQPFQRIGILLDQKPEYPLPDKFFYLVFGSFECPVASCILIRTARSLGDVAEASKMPVCWFHQGECWYVAHCPFPGSILVRLEHLPYLAGLGIVAVCEDHKDIARNEPLRSSA